MKRACANRRRSKRPGSCGVYQRALAGKARNDFDSRVDPAGKLTADLGVEKLGPLCDLEFGLGFLPPAAHREKLRGAYSNGYSKPAGKRSLGRMGVSTCF